MLFLAYMYVPSSDLWRVLAVAPACDHRCKSYVMSVVTAVAAR
jgi:hypothetical protein